MGLGGGWLGLTKTATANGRLLINATAQERGRVTRVIFSATDAAGLSVDLATILICDIRVGTSSQFSSNSPMPATILSANSQANNAGYCLATVEPGTDFSITVTNAIVGFTYTAGAVYESMERAPDDYFRRVGRRASWV